MRPQKYKQHKALSRNVVLEPLEAVLCIALYFHFISFELKSAHYKQAVIREQISDTKHQKPRCGGNGEMV